MAWAFLVPLLGGAIFFGVASRFCSMQSRACRFYRYGLQTITVGCLLEGAFHIYGIEVWQVKLYWLVGIGWVIVSVAVWLRQTKMKRG